METRKVELLKKKRLERNQDKWMKGERGFVGRKKSVKE
jgi:hypothetical protein